MINVAFGLDNNFARHCGAAIASILSNHKVVLPEDKIHFFLIGDLSNDNKRKFLELKNIQDFEIDFITIDEKIFAGLPALYHYNSTAIYNRLLIPEIFTSDIEKIIYLDCDIILNSDIKNLWQVDINGYLAAVVPIDGVSYFNSGVMIFNVTELKNFNFSVKWIDWVKNNKDKIVWHDQDILNALIKHNCLHLPIEWNPHYGYIKRCYSKKNAQNFKKTLHLMHYSTFNKPWHALCPHPFKDLYFQFAVLTPWGGEIKHYSAFTIAAKFSCLLFKYWLVHPVFFIKKDFYKRVKEKGWLISIY
jgi:lipopolysaccharide biosynthesis glycosyltransferase